MVASLTRNIKNSICESYYANFLLHFAKICTKCQMTLKGRHSHVESSNAGGSHELIPFIKLFKECEFNASNQNNKPNIIT